VTSYLYSIDPSSGTYAALGWVFWVSEFSDQEDWKLRACGLVRGPERAKLDDKCEAYYEAISQDLRRQSPWTYNELTARHAWGHVWVEQMRMTMAQDGKKGMPAAIAKGNDLLELQAVGAYVAGALGTLRYASPGTWKGQTSKEVTENRVHKYLTPSELAIVREALSKHRDGLAHNLYDAVGIGLHGTGRYRIR
jgi:hypothetical protein